MHSQSNPSIGMLLVEVSRLMRREFERQCSDHHALTQSQARTLVYLARNEGIRQVELAELLEVQPITLARQIDQLAELDIVERRADPQDRRAYRLFLLPAATSHLAEIRQMGETLRAKALQGLSENEIELLFHGLHAMRANLTSLPQHEDNEVQSAATAVQHPSASGAES